MLAFASAEDCAVLALAIAVLALVPAVVAVAWAVSCCGVGAGDPAVLGGHPLSGGDRVGSHDQRPVQLVGRVGLHPQVADRGRGRGGALVEGGDLPGYGGDRQPDPLVVGETQVLAGSFQRYILLPSSMSNQRSPASRSWPAVPFGQGASIWK